MQKVSLNLKIDSMPLVALCELVKMCNFFLDCTHKNLCDQVIKRILDGDMVKDLLQEKDFSLASAIQICQAQEVAKRQCASMFTGHQYPLAAVHNLPPLCRKPLSQALSSYLQAFPGCDGWNQISMPCF